MVERLIGSEKSKPAVLLAAAYLHDLEPVGQIAESDNQTSGKRGTLVAREILQNLDAPDEITEEVCSIIENLDEPNGHQSKDLDLVRDAHLLANLQERMKKRNLDSNILSEIINSDFVTDSGRRVAHELMLERIPESSAAAN
jgi:HD superfamily phosphodiesterase